LYQPKNIGGLKETRKIGELLNLICIVHHDKGLMPFFPWGTKELTWMALEPEKN